MMVVSLGQQHNVGEEPTVMLYTHIKSQCRDIKSKTKTKYTISLDYSSICYIGFRIGWVSGLLYYLYIISHQPSYRLTRQETRLCFMIIIR